MALFNSFINPLTDRLCCMAALKTLAHAGMRVDGGGRHAWWQASKHLADRHPLQQPDLSLLRPLPGEPAATMQTALRLSRKLHVRHASAANWCDCAECGGNAPCSSSFDKSATNCDNTHGCSWPSAMPSRTAASMSLAAASCSQQASMGSACGTTKHQEALHTNYAKPWAMNCESQSRDSSNKSGANNQKRLWSTDHESDLVGVTEACEAERWRRDGGAA